MVEHPEHGVLRTFVAGKCPMVAETQALTLIQELEDKKLRQLHKNTRDNALRLMDAKKIKNVDDYLLGLRLRWTKGNYELGVEL